MTKSSGYTYVGSKCTFTQKAHYCQSAAMHLTHTPLGAPEVAFRSLTSRKNKDSTAVFNI